MVNIRYRIFAQCLFVERNTLLDIRQTIHMSRIIKNTLTDMYGS